MASKCTKLKRHKNSWLDDVDELERKFKQTRKDDTDNNVTVKAPTVMIYKRKGKLGIVDMGRIVESEQVIDDRAIVMTEGTSVTLTISTGDTIENLKNTIPSNNHVNAGDKETSLVDQVQILNERGSAGMANIPNNIGQCSQIAEAQQMEEEEEIQVLRETLVQKPINVDIKPEISTDEEDEEEIQVLQEKLIQKPISMDIKQEFSSYEEEEIQIKIEEFQPLQEKLVQKPATMDVKQENSLDEENEIQIMYENLVQIPTISNIKQEQSAYQPRVTFTLVNGNLEITSVGKQPARSSEPPVNSKQPLGLKSPLNCEHPEGSPYVKTATGFTSTSTSSFTSSSSYNNSSPTGTSESPINSQLPEELPFVNTAAQLPYATHGLTITPVPSSATNSSPTDSSANICSLAGTSDSPINSRHSEEPPLVNTAAHATSGLIITPVRSSATNSFSTASARQTTDTQSNIQERVNRVNESQVTESIHDGTTRGNSRVNNESGTRPVDNETTLENPINNESEEVTVPLHEGPMCQKPRSQGNVTMKLGSGDVTVTDGGRTVQVKMGDGSIEGQAEDVINLVKTLKQVVYDL